MQELAAFVALVGILLSGAKYVADRFSKLDQVPFMLAKMHSGLKAEIKFEMKAQLDQMKTELLAAIKESKS